MSSEFSDALGPPLRELCTTVIVKSRPCGALSGFQSSSVRLLSPPLCPQFCYRDDQRGNQEEVGLKVSDFRSALIQGQISGQKTGWKCRNFVSNLSD